MHIHIYIYIYIETTYRYIRILTRRLLTLPIIIILLLLLQRLRLDPGYSYCCGCRLRLPLRCSLSASVCLVKEASAGPDNMFQNSWVELVVHHVPTMQTRGRHELTTLSFSNWFPRGTPVKRGYWLMKSTTSSASVGSTRILCPYTPALLKSGGSQVQSP